MVANGQSLLVATSHPDQFDALRAEMKEAPFTFLPVIADPRQIQSQITRLYGDQLAEQALVQVPDHESCRNWGQANLLKSKKVVLGGVAVLSTIAIFPDVALSIAMLWAALPANRALRPTHLKTSTRGCLVSLL